MLKDVIAKLPVVTKLPDISTLPNIGITPVPLTRPQLKVNLKMPKDPLFVGEYAKIKVGITSNTGVKIEDLDFKIPAGLPGGDVSLSRDRTFDPKNPDIMLLSGFKPGTYLLQAFKKGTATKVAEGKFEVTEHWKNDLVSPKLAFTGKIPNFVPGATWGGGVLGSPQNTNTIPALGTRRIAVLLVDTADQRYTTNATTLSAIQTNWRQQVQDGFVGSDGISRSVRAYFREVSYNNLDMNGTIFPNVVHLPDHWTDYFQLDPNNLWQAKGPFINQCVIAAGDGVDLSGFDMIVCVSQPFSSAMGGAQIAWPYGGYGVAVNTSHGMVSGRGVSMPFTWGDGTSLDLSNGRTIYETLTHELGHTINLPDEYTPDVPGRTLAEGASSWDPMDFEQPLPHFCLPHRMMLGWVPPAWIRQFDFQNLGTTVDEMIVLNAIELGAPPAGRFAGVEVRIADGHNYYFEYRIGQAMEIGDEALVPNGRVIGIDVVEPPANPIITRPDMLLLAQHSDDNGAVLDTGQFYHELDTTSPTFPSDFRVDVVSRNANSASIRLRYTVIGKPDPSIRPWPRDAAHPWQSPDIEVQNPRSLADPANWANVPWAGHNNTVIASVKNRGTLSAPGVVVNFFVKDYTIGGAPETFLGFDRQDVSPGATVNFQTSWNPPSVDNAHFCIIARIDVYETPTVPPILELTPFNNEAQSNYSRFISASASPATREIANVTIGNPYDKATRFFLRGGHDNPLYRTYLETTSVTLKPHEVRKIQVMFEFDPAAFMKSPAFDLDRKNFEKYLHTPNLVSFVGYVEDPHDKRLHTASLLSGAMAEVVTGRATEMIRFGNDGLIAFGEVHTLDNKDAVPDGKAIIAVKTKSKPDLIYLTSNVNQGFFRNVLPEDWLTAQAFYIPNRGFGECQSMVLVRK